MSTKATSSRPQASSAEAHKAFSDHIAELRTRAFWVVVVFILASALAYSFREQLIDFILSPLGDQQLVYLTPGGGFSFIFQVTMYAGAVVAAPLIVFHTYRFLKPALPARAQRNSFSMMVSSLLLMMAGVAFGYFVAIPSALVFLTTFAGDFVSPNLTAESYLGFVMAYLVGLGILFQLPLFLIIWNWINPINPGGLLNSQRFVFAFAYIAAAIITPTPDVINQSLVAGPIIAVYQLGVIAVFIMNRKARRAARIQRKATASETSKKPVLDVESEPVLSPDLVSTVSTRPVMDVIAPRHPRGQAVRKTQENVAASPTSLHKAGQTSTVSSVDGFIGLPRKRTATTRRVAVPQRSTQVQLRRAITPRSPQTRELPSLMNPSRGPVALDGFSIY